MCSSNYYEEKNLLDKFCVFYASKRVKQTIFCFKILKYELLQLNSLGKFLKAMVEVITLHKIPQISYIFIFEGLIKQEKEVTV